MSIITGQSDWMTSVPGIPQIAAGIVWGLGAIGCFRVTDKDSAGNTSKSAADFE